MENPYFAPKPGVYHKVAIYPMAAMPAIRAAIYRTDAPRVALRTAEWPGPVSKQGNQGTFEVWLGGNQELEPFWREFYFLYYGNEDIMKVDLKNPQGYMNGQS